MMFSRLFILASVLVGVAQASAQQSVEEAKVLAPALNESQSRLADARMLELTSRSADVTALRLDAVGTPVVRMDLFFGGVMPENEAAILRMLDSFTFADEDAARKDGANGWSTILVPTEPTAELVDMVHFEFENDLVIEFRQIEDPLALSCSMSFLINYNGTYSTGTNLYWYAYSDAITITTGPRRNNNADPDSYLYWWNGSAYQYFSGSSSASYLDTVSSYGSACNSYYWKVQIYMYAGGSFGVRGVTVSAS